MKIHEGKLLATILVIGMAVSILIPLSCTNTPDTETVAVDSVYMRSTGEPITYGKVIQSVDKPIRDTFKNVIIDTYKRIVTVTYDSTVIVGVYTGSVPPVDTVVVPPPGNYGILLYSTGYNAKTDIFNSSNQQGNGGLSTSIYKDGPGSFKSVPANVSSGIRSEVQYSSSMTPAEGAIEYDVMYETIFQNQGHSLQFHPNTSGGSASPGLWHENGKFVWVNWKGGTNTKYPTNFTIPQNRWMHVVFEYKIGSAGYMKFTIDGKVFLDKSNIQVGDGSGSYLKVGVNMWKDQGSVVYYDNLKIWKK